jgi:pimeloyl-ACP methyl ester carboxylesterase
VRVAAALLAAAAVVLAPAPAADAALRFHRCPAFLFKCARLSVPLDRSGAVPGRVSLLVTRVRAQKRPSRGAVFVLAGGPGQSATAAFEGDGLGVLAPAFRRRDLIVFDQRGTGRSGLLRCRALERSNLFDAGPAAGACARRLGARRHHYSSRASVEDIEAIRRELRVPKIALYGTSYGAKVALGYALTYPANVERLVLDSVVEVDGPDPFYLETLAAVPRALRSLCRSGCRAFTRDPVDDLTRLVGRIGEGQLRGPLVDPRGRRRRAGLTTTELFLILLSGDFDPALRAAFPGAVRAALDRDPAPLLRLERRSIRVDAEPPPPRLLSSALFTATTCEEMRFPWPRTASPDPAQRRALAEAAAAALAPDAFAPFDRGALLENDLLQLCDRWAAAPAAPDFGPGPLPDVPVLILEGEDDLRTPVENGRRVAALFPQAKLVVAPATGHSALGSDLSGCADRAFARFFSGRTVSTRCPRRRRAFRVSAPPPRRLSAVAPAPGATGVRGRAVGALALTLRDVAEDSLTELIVDAGDPDLARGGGLRAGRYRIDGRNALHLRGVAFVPGVRVSGVVRRFGERRQRGRVRLSGPAVPDGLLRLRGRRVSGRLGDKSVRAVLGRGAGAARAVVARRSLR